MSKFIPTTADEKARCSIIEDINTNIFVEAGAGSGKTTMLVNRMVAMVEAGIPVEKICAITFTKNAALEFYERFQARLIERINPLNDKPIEHAGDLDIPTSEGRLRCQKALENIDLCFMGTIDSFCNMILSEHPSEANIPSDTRLVNDNEASAIYKKFYVDVRKGLYSKKLQELSERFAMFFYNSEEMFAALIKEIMERRNVTFHYDKDLCKGFYECFSKQRNDLKNVLNVFAKDKSKICLPLDKNETRDTIEVFDDANATIQKGWEYNYKGVQYALKQIKDISYPGSCADLGFKNESVLRDTQNNSVITLNIGDSDSKDSLISKLNNYKYQNTLQFLTECIDPLSKLMKEEGKLTFFDYLLYLRDMLVEDSKKEGKLIEYIYNRHSYFLIDEFQDTNPMQAEVFFYLAAKDPKQNSWRDCKPKDGALFIVGDPKQSIYRFRSADVSSYLGIKQIFEDNKQNCEVKSLVNNFRSKNEVKSFFNDVFNEVMADDNDPEQSRYKDIENLNSLENDEEFKGIYKYISYSGAKLLSETQGMEDSEQIANVILSIMNSDKKIVDTDKNSDTYKQLRKIRFSDFMVIFYNKKNIPLYIEKFKEEKYRIPIRVEGKVLFEESDALKTITSIYKTVTSRDDTISLVETLKCPVFAYSNSDISEYKNNGNEIKLDLSKEYSQSGIEEALNKLSSTARNISTQTPSSLYEKIIDDYQIFKYVTCDSLEIVYYVLELLKNEENNGNIITYEDGVNYLNELISGKSDQERCLSLKQNIDAVHMANLHKVKGLEAPIVILAKSGVNYNPYASIRIEYKNDPITNRTLSEGYICSIKDPNSDRVMAIETDSIPEIRNKEVKSLKKEVNRLVYVAATRARNVLIVNDKYQKKGDKIDSYPSSNQWKYLLPHCKDDIFNVIANNPTPIIKKEIEKQADDLYAEVKLTKLSSKQSYEIKKPSDIKIAPKTIEQPAYEEEKTSDKSKLLGTIVHRLLEMIIMSNNKLTKDKLINSIIGEYLIDESDNKVKEYKNILESVFDVMNNGGYPQNNDAPQDILNEILNAQAKYSEIPFAYKDEKGVIWNGVIDLLYVKDDKAYIIDWKTNKDDSDLDKHYQDQLNAYKTAVNKILGIEVESAIIYHINL